MGYIRGLIVASVVVMSVPAAAQSELLRPLLNRPVAIRSDRGWIHDPVDTNSRDAQAFYDQGLAYLHSYVWLEAARSFHQAIRADEHLAMAYVGLSYAEWYLDSPEDARDALARAVGLSTQLSARELQRVRLRSLDLASVENPNEPDRLIAYRKALDAALAETANEPELWLLRGMAEASTPGDRGQASPLGSVPYYDHARQLDPTSFASYHYLTHAYENTGKINDAAAMAAVYVRLAPGIPHAHHMLGHELRRSGDIDRAISEFQTADDIQVSYATREGVPPNVDWHFGHNLDVLASSLQFAGRKHAAELLFKRAFALPSNHPIEALNKGAYPRFLMGVRRWPEAAEAATTMNEFPSVFVKALSEILIGRAQLGVGEDASAANHANEAATLLQTAREGPRSLLSELAVLRAEFFLKTKQTAKARDAVNRALESLDVNWGPDEWTEAVFSLESLATASRESGNWSMAETIAVKLLKQAPSYGGTHYELAKVADHKGDVDGARKEFTLAERYWRDADNDLAERVDSQAWLAAHSSDR